jgi:hypothetical protein
MSELRRRTRWDVIRSLFASVEDRIVCDFLLVMLVIATAGFALFPRVSYQNAIALGTAGTIATITTGSALVYWRLLRPWGGLASLHAFVERHALKLLVGWTVALLCWSAVIMFANPYQYEFNGGDAGLFSQMLWNMTHGLKPEMSWLTLNGVFHSTDDPRYPNAYGYVSVFTLHQFWLPLALMTPLYALYPHPPMHVFALQLWVIGAGVPGMYWAARQAGTSRVFAVGAAIGYSALPQVGTQLFFMGFMDVLGLAVLPWLFGAILGRRWRLAYVLALFSALISFPFAIFTVLIGVALALFRGLRKHGAIIALIGGLVTRFDSMVMISALSAYPATPSAKRSLLTSYILDRGLSTLIEPAKFNVMFVGYLLQATGFLALLALWRSRDTMRRQPILLLFAFLALVYMPMLFRSYSWQFQRNSAFIVPAYMTVIVGYVALSDYISRSGGPSRHPSVPAMLALCAMGPMIAIGNPFRTGILRSHYPWGTDVTAFRSDETRRWNATLARLDSIVPIDATLAWDAQRELSAVMTNRRDSWYVGREPNGVRFYAFVGNSQETDGFSRVAVWLGTRARLRRDSTFRLVYEGNPGFPLEVYENLTAVPVPRRPELLGWGIVMKPFLPGR